MINQYTNEEIKIRSNEEIDIRDTYILPFEGKYYMYGTQGFEAFEGTPGGYLCYVGTDLQNWEGPYTAFPNNGQVWANEQYWAPEVYYVNGAFYMLSAWKNAERPQTLCILKAEHPLGPFHVLNDDLGMGNDPTLYCENGVYYMIHNDMQDHMMAHPLKEDFSGFAGDPIPLFARTDADVTWSKGGPCEGAETFVTPTGKLLILWSSFCQGDSDKFRKMGFIDMDYGTAIAYSESGSIFGRMRQENVLITPPNMGHVNLFETFGGQLMLATHWPDDDDNALGCSTPVFFKVQYDQDQDTIRIAESEFKNINEVEQCKLQEKS
ncbi:family 43 glycosylhydrolase [Bifidobacterium moukalabense]|uniref:family 43 glycosylhydrolase n=1 Tax=Bifidobacterium moukalabense TaxID=1333651 RepID=UPI0010F5C051|nr:family 43 glycosylhydrolase [Bifidobacterium moukalabense]